MTLAILAAGVAAVFLALTLIEGRDNDYGNEVRRLLLALFIVGFAGLLWWWLG